MLLLRVAIVLSTSDDCSGRECKGLVFVEGQHRGVWDRQRSSGCLFTGDFHRAPGERKKAGKSFNRLQAQTEATTDLYEGRSTQAAVRSPTASFIKYMCRHCLWSANRKLMSSVLAKTLARTTATKLQNTRQTIFVPSPDLMPLCLCVSLSLFPYYLSVSVCVLAFVFPSLSLSLSPSPPCVWASGGHIREVFVCDKRNQILWTLKLKWQLVGLPSTGGSTPKFWRHCYWRPKHATLRKSSLWGLQTGYGLALRLFNNYEQPAIVGAYRPVAKKSTVTNPLWQTTRKQSTKIGPV